MIKLLGVPFDGNSSFMTGPAEAPDQIRQRSAEGSANDYCERGRKITADESYNDLGDISFDSQDPSSAFHIIHSRIQEEITNGEKIVVLGGDHSITYPIIKAFAGTYDELHILHLDAHPDLYNTFENNPYSHASPFARIMENNLVTSLTQVGLRTFNTHQRHQATKFRCKVLEMKDYFGEFVDKLQGPLYISLDMDVLDPAYAPGLSHHEPGGMTARQLIKLIQSLKVPVIGADIVELNPKRDINNMTAMLAFKLMKEIISKMMD